MNTSRTRFNRRRFCLTGILVATATLLLVACAPAGPPAAQPTAAPGAAPGKEVAGSQPTAPFKIGLSGALTGGDAILGQTQREGVQLAVDEINAAGGIGGRMVELVVEDEANDPSRMAEIAQRFITRDRVDAIIGGTNDGTAQVLSQTAESARVPLVVPFANGDQITRGKRWSFQVDVASTTFVQKLVDHAVKNYQRIGIIYDDNAFGQADRDFALEDLRQVNRQAVAVVSIPDVGRDYTPQLSQFRNANAEVLIAPVSGTNAAQLRKDMVRIGYEPLILGPNSLAFQSMIDVGQQFVEQKVILLDVIDETKPEVQQFQQRFQAKYNKRATSGFELLGYDAMKIMAYALERGGNDKEKVRSELENLRNYTAVSGKAGSTISYSPEDHRRASPGDLVWRWVQNGQFANAPITD